MAGLYIHIPFCKQACTYCNFHFSTTGDRAAMLHAICREIIIQQDFLSTPTLRSIYFGGGTPSVLTAAQLDQIFEVIYQHFSVDSDAEITLEANPDDLTTAKLSELKNLSVNRLSIGVQSFRDEDLNFMNRAHTSEQAYRSIRAAQDHGFKNLSIDLIYGVPGLSVEDWHDNLERANLLDVQHLSCYALTVEAKTTLAHHVKHRKVIMPPDEAVEIQFHRLLSFARAHKFDHYEISNFCKEGYLAVHNTNYWKQESYLGIGPSAHSFDGESRIWNVANNAKYVHSLQQDLIPQEREILSAKDRFNEYILTGLRTKWGCVDQVLSSKFTSFYQAFLKDIDPFISNGMVVFLDGCYVLSDHGKLFADRIASELFAV